MKQNTPSTQNTPATQNLGNVRRNLTLDNISALERILNTFIAIAESHPELIVEYHFGSYSKKRCAEVDKFREEHPNVVAATGAGTNDMVTFYKENAQYILEDVLLGKIRQTR